MEKSVSQKKIIIIGAGISGITSGIYGQKNGFITEIYERCANPGGLCTSWTRKNFPIDGCIHWMTGTKKGTALYNMWQDCGAFLDKDIIRGDNFGTVEVQGKQIVFWHDIDKLEKELIEIAPEDTKKIKRMCNRIYLFQNMPLPIDMPVNTMKLWDFIKIGFNMIPYLFSYLHGITTSTAKYCSQFKSPILKEAIFRIIGSNYNMYSTLYVYGTTALGNGGVPRGGSSSLINNMVSTYEELGGKINLCSDVKEIIVENGKAVGIRLKNGGEKRADYVIAACDPFHTKTLLNGKYDFSKFEKRSMKSKNNPLPSCVLVSFAANKNELDNLKLTSTFEFETPEYKVGASTFKTVKIRNYSYDKHFIKDGKVLLNVLIPQYDDDYPVWKAFTNRADYLKEKNRVANIVKEFIENRFPSLKNNLEIIDVVSPTTFTRYTNAFRGAYMPWALTSRNTMLLHNGKVKGVKNLVLSSQWTVMPGGLPVALMTGKFAIQRILKKEKKFYRITKPVKFSYTR